jgi:hypothetical protein
VLEQPIKPVMEREPMPMSPQKTTTNMQLKKWNWKRMRDRVPCSLCGGDDHPANKCTRRCRTGHRRAKITVKGL